MFYITTQGRTYKVVVLNEVEKERNLIRNRAQSKAKQMLVRKYYAEYSAMYRAECLKAGLKVHDPKGLDTGLAHLEAKIARLEEQLAEAQAKQSD